MINSIDQDGTLRGLDFNFIKYLNLKTKIPILIGGGSKNYKDFLRAFKDYNLSAVVSSSIYIFTENTPQTIKEVLIKQNIPIRLV